MHINSKRALFAFSVAAFMFVSSGCVSKQPWEIASIQKKMLEVQMGMTTREVIDLLGTPVNREVVPDRNGKAVEFLFYQTSFTHTASPNFFAATDAEITPFAFSDDKLLGWGRNYYDRATRHELSVHEIIEQDYKGQNTLPQNSDKYDSLEKLKKLLDEGAISKEEYDREKAKILQ